MACLKPMPSRPPMRFSTGTRTSLKWVSTTGTPRIPILSSTFSIVNPGVPFSTMKALIRDLEVGSVTAKTE